MANNTPSPLAAPPGGFGGFSAPKTAGANVAPSQTPSGLPQVIHLPLANPANQDSLKKPYVATDRLLNEIKFKEGFLPVAQIDQNSKSKVVQAGYGFTTKPDGKTPWRVGDRITREEADRYLYTRTNDKVIKTLQSTIPHWDSMTTGQKDALSDFAHNYGEGFYGHPDHEIITDALKYGDWDEVPEILNIYNKGNNQVLPGLVTRRKKEGEWWSEVTDESKNQILDKNKPFASIPGLRTKGNINLKNRQQVKNQDGTISTVRSISINSDGKEILIPTVVNGKVVSNKEAIEHWKKTGQHLGIFDNSENATAYAKKLHNKQEQLAKNAPQNKPLFNPRPSK